MKCLMHTSSLVLIAAAVCSSSASTQTIELVTDLTPDHNQNLLTNGSFEGHPGPSTVYHWASGTIHAPQATPAGWTGAGGSANYAGWGNTTFFWNSAVIPDGVSALYFGNQYAASISETPAFEPSGLVVFTDPAVIVPDPAGYSPAVTLSQTVGGLLPGRRYGLSFWVSGEHATLGTFGHDGIFGLDATGCPTTYLAAPSGHSNLGTSHVYQFVFVPATVTATIQFTSWGHFSPGAPGNQTDGWDLPWTTELILDDVVLNLLPECVVAPTNMVGWWPLDEPSGTVAHDIQSGLDGTHEGSPLPVATPGMVSNGLEFTPQSHVLVEDDPLLAVGTSDFTIDAWIRQNPLPCIVPVVSKGASVYDPTRGPGVEWGLWPGSAIGQYLLLSGGSSSFSAHLYTDSAFTLFDQQWHHIAVTVHRSGTPPLAVTFYVDGTPIPDQSSTTPLATSLTSTDPLLFATSLWSGGYESDFDGALDEIEIFDRALDASEIQSIYEAGSAGKCKPECSYLHDDLFEENDDCDSAADVSPFTSYPGLYVTKIDDDWYRMTVPAGKKLTVRALFDHVDGNIDMELYDGCNGALLGTGSSIDDDEQIAWTNGILSPRVLALRVFVHPASMSDCNRYVLSYDLSGGYVQRR